MRLYDMRVLHFLDERVVKHRLPRFCYHLWCWHVLEAPKGWRP